MDCEARITKRLKFIVAGAVALCSASMVQAASSPMTDNFNDNTLNPATWKVSQLGSGPALAESNGQLEIYFPSFSEGDAFGAGYISECKLNGDFDIQVDYNLLSWPNGNGVRIGLAAFDPDNVNPMYGPASYVVERTSFGIPYNDFNGWPREVYLTDFNTSVSGIAETSDTAGTLRLVRTGSDVTGFHGSGSTWVPVQSGAITTGDLKISISAWSHDYVFIDQEVKLAFDNFTVNKGALVCNGKTVVPVDIKPGIYPNSINPGSNGTLPVAILSTTSFDATTVNPATVTLAGAAVAMKGKGTPNYSIQDVDGDGLMDLIVHVQTEALHLSAGDVTAEVSGKTFDGKLIKGSDTIRIVPE